MILWKNYADSSRSKTKTLNMGSIILAFLIYYLYIKVYKDVYKDRLSWVRSPSVIWQKIIYICMSTTLCHMLVNNCFVITNLIAIMVKISLTFKRSLRNHTHGVPNKVFFKILVLVNRTHFHPKGWWPCQQVSVSSQSKG